MPQKFKMSLIFGKLNPEFRTLLIKNAFKIDKRLFRMSQVNQMFHEDHIKGSFFNLQKFYFKCSFFEIFSKKIKIQVEKILKMNILKENFLFE